MKKKENILIIGSGKTGTHLFYSLNFLKRFNLKFTGKIKEVSVNLKKLISWSDIIFITTRDKDIPKITKILLETNNLNNKFIYHTSGSQSSEVLHSLAKRRALTGSFHPVQTFESKTERNAKKLSGIFIALEGGSDAIKKAKEIVRLLSSKSIVLNKNQKILHHICCVLASGLLVSHLHLIEKLSSQNLSKGKTNKIQFNEFHKHNFFSIYKPLAEQTFKNMIKKGFKDSLTGPIERNDIPTLSGHLKTLKKYSPDILQYYKILSLESLEIARIKNKIPKTDYQKIYNLLNRK